MIPRPTRRSAARHAAACLALLVLTAAFHPGVVRHAGARLDHAGDPLLNAWILSWNLHALGNSPSDLWNANIFHPHRHTLAYSENLLLPSLLVAPVRAFTDNPILLYNVAFLLGVFLSAVSAYALGVFLTRSSVLGMLLAVAFAFCPFRLAHAGHMQFQHGQWMPLALMLAWRHLDPAPPGARGRAACLLGAALCLVAQFLSNTYYFMFFAPALALFQLCLWARLAPGRRGPAAAEAAAMWCVAAVALLPFAWPYAAARSEAGLGRSLPDLRDFTATLRDYFAYNDDNAWFGQARRRPGVERMLAPGVVLLACAALPWLAAAAQCALRVIRGGPAGAGRGRCALPAAAPAGRAALAVFTIFAVWMSLGPGRGPYGLFFRFVPGYDGLRAPARFAGVAMLGLGALAAVNLAAAVRGIRRPAARATVCAAALAALVTEYWSAPRQMRFAPAPKPAYDWLRAAPPGPVIEFPVPRREADMWREAVYEFYSTRHWRPLFNGYSGYSPPDYRVACRYLDSFPDSVSVSVLRHFGIRYAVVHRCNDRKAREIGKWLEPAASFGSDRVFTVPAAPAGTPPRAGLSGRGILPSGAWAVAAVSPHKPGAAAALRDSDSGTGWEAAADGDSEASLDLAFVRSVRPAALRLHFGARATAFPRRLRVLARGDDGAWREIGFNQDPLDFVASATERPRDPVMDIALAASPPGPLRLVLADGDPAWGIYVADIEVFARSRQER